MILVTDNLKQWLAKLIATFKLATQKLANGIIG